MSGQSIELPAGTVVTKQITLPTCGSWLGLIRTRLSTWGADATIHEWLFIWPNGPNNKTRYRRTAISSANNWYNSVLKKDQEALRWLAQNESIMRITYTATNPISLSWESCRGITPFPYPPIPTLEWNKKTTSPTANLWTVAATGNNLSSTNTTEKGPVGFPGQLNGKTYWITTP